MFVSKLALPRRTFLRGAGTVLALPLLDAMVPALTPIARTAAAPVVRMGFIYRPNGYIRQFWTPDKAGANPDFKRSLAALEPFRDRTLIVSGLANLEAEAKGSSPGPHSRSSAAWMTGTHAKQTEGADVQAGISADQVAAQVLGKNTVLPSLELAIEQNEQMVGNCEAGYSCLYQNTISWRTPTTPLPMETHPRVVFQRLFGDGGTPAQQRRQLETSGSILDAVTERLGQLSKKLGPGDRARLEQYTESVREIETRIDKAEKRTADSSVEVPDRPSDIPSGFAEHVKLMFDLQALAFQTDVTRVFSFLMVREASVRSYPEIGVPDSHHPLSHHQNNPEKLSRQAKLNTFQMKMLTYFLDTLAATKEGDGNMLDNSVLLYGSGMSDSNLHLHKNLPITVVHGKNMNVVGNRHVKAKDGTPLANLQITLLGKMGIGVDKFGDGLGELDLMTGL